MAEPEQAETPPSYQVPEVYTDSSFLEEAPGMEFPGFGVWFSPLNPCNVALPLEGQTDDPAELTACVKTLKAVPGSQPLRIVTDVMSMTGSPDT